MTTIRKEPEGLIGRKLGMTQVFSESGEAVPVTVVELGPCVILDVLSATENGYSAVKFGFAPKNPARVNKPEMGNFNKAGKGAFQFVKEMRCDVDKLGWNMLGEQIAVDDVFATDDLVDVTGTSKGRGFAGVFKKFGMKGQPASRGTHEVKRHGGAIGNRKTPGRVFKNKKMPGHLGNSRVTLQNLKVIGLNAEEGLLMIKGCVPGPKGGFVEVRRAMKSYAGAIERTPKSVQKIAEQNAEQAADNAEASQAESTEN